MSVCKSLLFKQAVKTVTSKVLATFKVFKVSVTIPPPLGTCHLELERQSVTDVNLCSIISIVNSANEWPTISLALAFLFETTWLLFQESQNQCDWYSDHTP